MYTVSQSRTRAKKLESCGPPGCIFLFDYVCVEGLPNFSRSFLYISAWFLCTSSAHFFISRRRLVLFYFCTLHMKARERELATFDEIRRAEGMLNPMRNKNWRHVPGGRRDDTWDHSLSRSWQVVKVRPTKKNEKSTACSCCSTINVVGAVQHYSTSRCEYVSTRVSMVRAAVWLCYASGPHCIPGAGASYQVYSTAAAIISC